ncbi:MAG: hypothetical protein H6Q90_3295 [Deltaproteobacteria bacterium]|nr:hypothetical protein [Deltaproteobacteria bacterium]
MINDPRMTTRGRTWAIVFGLVIVLALPKHVECGQPGSTECAHRGSFRRTCTSYEVEPFGFYLIELAVRTDVGFAYSSGEDCR